MFGSVVAIESQLAKCMCDVKHSIIAKLCAMCRNTIANFESTREASRVVVCVISTKVDRRQTTKLAMRCGLEMPTVRVALQVASETENAQKAAAS